MERSRRGERVGILGGTFDPVHIGHLVVADEARHALELDRVLLVVANDPWQKRGGRPLTAAEDRYAMVAAATEGVAGIEADRREIDRGGPSYTIDTVAELSAAQRQATLFLVVGADVAAELDTWHRADELARAVTLVVVDRGGVAQGPDPAGWTVVRLAVPALEISSSDLRRRLAEGRGVDFLVPEAAMRCIRTRGLYASR